MAEGQRPGETLEPQCVKSSSSGKWTTPYVMEIESSSSLVQSSPVQSSKRVAGDADEQARTRTRTQTKHTRARAHQDQAVPFSASLW